MSDPMTLVSFVAPEFVALDVEAAGADDGSPAVEHTDEPDEPDEVEPVPLGTALTTALKEGLEARGWAVDYQWTTPYGHAFDARAREGKRRYDVELVVDDSEQGSWLVTCKQRTGLFRRLFKGGTDPNEHRRLCVDTHGTLAADNRVTDVRWHREDDWSGSKRDGAPEPG